MTPGPTVIRRCSACNKLNAQHTIASGNTFGAKLIPVTSDYEQLSRDSAQPPEKQRYLRRCRWWAGNDARRGNSQPTPLSEAERQNLESFAGLLDEAVDQDRLIKAEVLRELGRFEDVVRLLSQDFDPKMAWAATFIRDLATKRDPLLRELSSK